MNKNKSTYNSTDVYEALIKELMRDNPDFWVKGSKKKKRKIEFLYRDNKKNKEVEEVINFTRWLKIINLYYLLGRKKVIQGERFKLGHRLGAIQARTIARNFKKKSINWSETKKQPLITDPVTGKQKRARIVHHTSETYSRIAWEKLRSIPNEKLYQFVPSQGSMTRGGFKQEFKMALKNNPLLQTQYKQFTHELRMD